VKLLRSWPAVIPEGRGHVVDSIERFMIDRYDYRPLTTVGDDVLLLEWDIAVGQTELKAFATRARATPDDVLVAPYRIYADTYGLPDDIWAHRWWDGDGAGTVSPNGARPVATGDPTCNLFGLGMVYLPQALIKAHVTECWSAQFGDTQFSMWHYQNVKQDVPVMWDVRPVHLHYLIPEI
jgi:hypothetical protein